MGSVYNLSLIAGLETSVLIDANGQIQIDWGSPGRVPLRPPVGMMAPFRVWVHTHPGFHAYWSGTDKNSLAMLKGFFPLRLFLEPQASSRVGTWPDNGHSIGLEGPLQHWTEEDITPWDRWYAEHQETPIEVMV